MSEDSKFVKGLITGVLVALASTAILIFFMRDYLFNGNQNNRSGTSSSESDDRKYEIFKGKLDNILWILKRDYYEDIDPEVLYEGALDGMMAALDDPYSCYYTASEAQQVFQTTDGSYVGIGCYVGETKDTNDIMVVSVMEDSPAEKAGLKPEDIIIAVDGRDITNVGLEYAMSLVKGAEGTSVVLTVKRGDETLDLSMTRAKIEQHTVSYRMLEDGIGYIYVSAFYKNTTADTRAAIEDLEKQGMTKLIVDLRENPGGLFDTAVEMLDIFLEKGLLVESFVKTFLNDYGYLFDYVDGPMMDWSVRPNMIFAVALDYSPLAQEQKKSVLDVCTRELLTPKGLRSLSPKSGGYNPMYVGPQTQRDYAYHQGTAWPWLGGFYMEACLKLYKRTRLSFIERQVVGYEDEMKYHCLGTISELFDGNPPFLGRGAMSFAMNVAEILRTLKLLESYSYQK